MHRTAWAVYLWPGLPQLWLDGAVSGLLMAVGCGAMLNLLLLSSYVWSELLTPGQLKAGWGAAAVVWLLAAAVSLRGRRRRKHWETAPAAVDLFRAAISEYLRGHWYEAETLLGRLLTANAGDIEARLMWATLLRRTRRYAEAKTQLSLLERLDGAARWQEEIARECQRLAEVRSAAANRPAASSAVVSSAAVSSAASPNVVARAA